MAGRITVWGASQLLTAFFAQTNTPPPSFWLALIRTVAPTPYLSGAELDEPDNADYARVEIVNDDMSWGNDSAPQEVYNLLPVEFMTATSDWGQIGYWALCNASVDGYCMLIGDLEQPATIMTGDQAVLAAGDLSASLGPFFLVEED